jgi:hypothetical protein
VRVRRGSLLVEGSQKPDNIPMSGELQGTECSHAGNHADGFHSSVCVAKVKPADFSPIFPIIAKMRMLGCSSVSVVTRLGVQ